MLLPAEQPPLERLYKGMAFLSGDGSPRLLVVLSQGLKGLPPRRLVAVIQREDMLLE
jgi:hypothetical protein